MAEYSHRYITVKHQGNLVDNDFLAEKFEEKYEVPVEDSLGGIVCEGDAINWLCNNFTQEIFGENAVYVVVGDWREKYNDFPLYVVYKKEEE